MVRNAAKTAETRIAPRVCGSAMLSSSFGTLDPGFADETAQRAVHAHRLPELLRQLSEALADLRRRALRLPDLACQRLRHREVLEQRDNVGESFVERRHVDIGPLGIAGMQPVEQRVRRLVRDDVVRDDAEDDRAAHDRAAAVGGREIAEQQGDLLRIVVGVRLPQRVRIDSQRPHVAVVRHGLALLRAGRRRAQSALRPSARSKRSIVRIATA